MSLVLFARLAVLCAVVLTFALPVHGQWSDAPSANLVVAERPAGQTQPKLAPTSDGGFYVSWFGGPADGFDVYLQRLDADGVAQWADGGIRVADRSFSSTEEYGLAVDSEGHAVLAFRVQDAQGVTQIAANRVSPGGDALWGETGVTVSGGSGGANSPRLAPLRDGSVVVGWTSFEAGGTRLQRLDGSGQPLWGTDGVTLSGPSGVLILSDLQGTADSHVVASFSAQLAFSDRRLWAQKLDAANGAALWGNEPVEVFDGSGGALQLGYFPTFVADADGGAVFAWYQVGAIGAARVRVQHVRSDGGLAFQQNGIDVSTNEDRQHLAPSVAYDAVSGDVIVAWPEDRQIGQDRTFAVAAQRIAPDGTRRWGATGRTLVPMQSQQTSQISTLAFGGEAIVAWTLGSGPGTMRIEAARLDAEGTLTWQPEVVPIKTASQSHSRMSGALGRLGFAAYVWTENDGARISAQNVDLTGRLGPVVPPEAGLSAEQLEITIYTGSQDGIDATFDLSNLATSGNDLLYAIDLDAPTLPDGVLTATPSVGTVGAGSGVEVRLALDASSVEAGIYSFELHLTTNDPENLHIVLSGEAYVITADTESEASARSFRLDPVYPNPTRGPVSIPFELPEAGAITLAVYDVAGRRVALIAEGGQPSGRHEVEWTPRLAAGIYTLRLSMPGHLAQTQRLVLLD